jgi:23S rRNA (uridine2552-2'-O)-methyltransferase
VGRRRNRKGLADRAQRADRFHQQARRLGYRARSVFKLEELDQKLRLLSVGQRVLDLGCAPGSWIQYAAEKVGRAGALVGLDRAPIELELPNFRMVVGDVHEVDPAELLGNLSAFDVVLSDMAPDTTGVRHVDQSRSEALFERALAIAESTLAPGGNFAAKLFMGPDFPDLLARCRREFSRVKAVKPAGSRTESIEQYVVGLGFAPPPPG